MAAPGSRRVIQIAVSLVVVAVIFYLLFRRLDLAGVWAEIKALTWIEMTTIVGIVVWNILTYSGLWVAATPGLGVGQATVLTQAGTAVTNTVPGGSALGVGLAYTMLDSWGLSRTRATIAVLVTGAFNALIKFGLPVLALALVALQGRATGRRVTAGLVGIGLLATAVVVFALVLRSDRVAMRVGELGVRIVNPVRLMIRRPPARDWGARTVRFRGQANDLLRRRWLAITVAAIVSHLSLYLVLLVTLRHVGVSNAEVSWTEVLAAFAVGRLLTMVRFTPGGAGAVEAVMISGLVAAGGAKESVAAAVLLFRALTWLLPIPLGAIAYLGWRRRRARSRAEAAAPV